MKFISVGYFIDAVIVGTAVGGACGVLVGTIGGAIGGSALEAIHSVIKWLIGW